MRLVKLLKAVSLSRDEFEQILVDKAVEVGTAEPDDVDAWMYGAYEFVELLRENRDELGRVVFDTENWAFSDGFVGIETGFKSIDGTTILLGSAGGDWEYPIGFCLYVGVDCKVHGYVPEHGNTYNPRWLTAYGSEGENPDYPPGSERDEDFVEPVVDNELMLADITAHIGCS